MVDVEGDRVLSPLPVPLEQGVAETLAELEGVTVDKEEDEGELTPLAELLPLTELDTLDEEVTDTAEVEVQTKEGDA